MKILTSVDSFKGSLGSAEINSIIADELRKKGMEVIEKPLADGGEGTIDALINSSIAEKIDCTVTDGLGNSVKSYYAMMKNHTAVIETAQICGLPMISKEMRNPMYTTTYGIGEAVIDAVSKGAESVVIALGGSATNDLGIGMLQAFGVTVSNESGQPVTFGAEALKDVSHIDFSTCMTSVKTAKLTVITDVKNPLLGDNGATFIFGPQKGLSNQDCINVEKQIKRLCSLSPAFNSGQSIPGAGAAGGLGAACLAIGAEIYGGAEWFMETMNIKNAVQEADIIITGEGKLDSQTLSGKGPIQISHYAKSLNKPVIAVAGSIDIEVVSEFYGSGITSCLSVLPEIQPLETAMTLSQTQKNISYISQQIASLLTMTHKYSIRMNEN